MTDEQMAASGNMAELESRYRPKIYRYLLNRLLDVATVEQVTNETFAQVAKQLSLFDPSLHFKSWLYCVADHKSKDAYARLVELGKLNDWIGNDCEPRLLNA
jgi:DNA-directed RNA polymerase specialized sigma24 family protein